MIAQLYFILLQKLVIKANATVKAKKRMLRSTSQKLLLFLFKIIMEIIIGLFIFCLVLFIYLHIQFHLKTGEDLEMYEVDEPSKEKLEDRRKRYNKAKDKLNELFPTTKIINFSSVDCTKEEDLFCTLPDDYVEGCYDATLSRNPTQQQITLQNNIYAAKIDNCIKKNIFYK